MKPKPEDFDYTVEKIREMTAWTGYQGFVGETCGSCSKTANVLSGGPGWICVCGHYNAQLFYGGPMPHEEPDLGPTRKTILEAHGVV